MVLQSWEKRVQPGVLALSALQSQVLGDLDTVNGGIGWWKGMTSWRHLALLSDYLLQSLAGAGTSLEYAALSAEEHRGIDAAMDRRLKEYWKMADSAANPLPRATDTDRKSEARRSMTLEGVLYHLSQCLDRLAPAVLIVGAVNVKDVVTSDWGTLANAQGKLALESGDQSGLRAAAYDAFAPAGSAARQLQEALFEPLNDLERYGKPDWLSWLRETRNAATHRAPGVQWNILKGRPGRPEGLHRGLARQPKRTDIQNLVRQKSDRRALEDVVLAPSTPDVLDGLVASTVKLTEAVGGAMTTCWEARRASPELLTQPGRQWRDMDMGPASRFTGDGPPVKLLLGPGATVHVGPALSRRIQAARVLDSHRDAWDGD